MQQQCRSLQGCNAEFHVLDLDRREGILIMREHTAAYQSHGLCYPLIDYKVVQVNGKNVLRVSCGMANTPCFLEDTEFYVRSGPSTDMLEGKKQHEYIKERF